MYNSEINSTHIVKGARFFPCSITDEESGQTYEFKVKSPKLKVYKKFMSIGDDSTLDDLINLIVTLLKNNANNIPVTPEFIEDNMDVEDIMDLFDDFATWLSESRKTSPN